SAPAVDDEKLRNLAAILTCVEPHQGEAGDLAADPGPPCRAPLLILEVSVEVAVGECTVDGLCAGKPGHVVDIELQIAPKHISLARDHCFDPDLRCHLGCS